jgi:hypothetical protein
MHQVEILCRARRERYEVSKGGETINPKTMFRPLFVDEIGLRFTK